MPQISRKYTFQPKKKIQSAQMNEELDQLVQAHNDLDTNKVSKADVLIKGDATPYVPVASTDPATKGYVDSTITGLVLGQVPDGSITDPKIGTRTIDDTVAATDGADTPTHLWSKLANMIKSISGKPNWFTAPATTLEAASAHMAATAGVHGAASAANPNALVIRDAGGRAQFASPAAAGDAATKGYVDGGFARIQTGTYTGDGTSNRTIAVGFTPKFVFTIAPSTTSNTTTQAMSTGGSKDASYGVAGSQCVTNGFRVGATSAAYGNANGVAYEWVAFA